MQLQAAYALNRVMAYSYRDHLSRHDCYIMLAPLRRQTSSLRPSPHPPRRRRCLRPLLGRERRRLCIVLLHAVSRLQGLTLSRQTLWRRRQQRRCIGKGIVPVVPVAAATAEAAALCWGADRAGRADGRGDGGVSGILLTRGSCRCCGDGDSTGVDAGVVPAAVATATATASCWQGLYARAVRTETAAAFCRRVGCAGGRTSLASCSLASLDARSGSRRPWVDEGVMPVPWCWRRGGVTGDGGG